MNVVAQRITPRLKNSLWIQDVMVRHDPADGVLIASNSLVLQGVGRRTAGQYACVASNLEGDTQSNSLQLKVKCMIVDDNQAWTL